MRTTLTLDPDVAERLKQEVRRTGKALKTVVNEVLRQGLAPRGRSTGCPRFKVEPHSFGFKPGVDLDRLNQFVDELEATETQRTLSR